MAHSDAGHDPTKSPHGFEDTEPANKIILASAIGSIGLLIFFIPFFHSYFNSMTDGEIDEKVQLRDEDGDGTPDYLEARNIEFASKRQALADNPISITAAMEQLATRGRNHPAVRPRRNDGLETSVDDAVNGLGAVHGWAQMQDDARRQHAEDALRARRAAEEAAAAAAREAAAARVLEATEATAVPAVRRPRPRRPGLPPQ
jgi:hypothetical protein